MSRYIDADKFIERLNASPAFPNMGMDGYFLLGVVEDLLKSFPTADVVEVRHGRIQWVNRPISAQYATVTDEYGEKHYGKVHDFIENNPVGYCGECGKRLDDTFMNYCPNCGAKMDGERRETDG